MDNDDFIDLMVAAVAVFCVVLVYTLAKLGVI
jgi:hypothetical protein